MSAREETRRRIARITMVINAMGVTAQQASERLREASIVMSSMGDRLNRDSRAFYITNHRIPETQVTHPEEPLHMQMVRKQTKRQQKRSARSKR